jgi:hypothetical protein
VDNYEIRILKTDGSAAIITAEIHYSDEAAIRSGEKISQGMQFEVWRGIDRVFISRQDGAGIPHQSAIPDRIF